MQLLIDKQVLELKDKEQFIQVQRECLQQNMIVCQFKIYMYLIE